jgi:hypothetical protein
MVIMVLRAEWIGVELQVRWSRMTGKEQPVKTDEGLKSALLKMKKRG